MDDPIAAARAGGLRYVSDIEPGISRIRRGSGFSYRDADGKPVRDDATLRRIKALAIPPAWQDVWISPSVRGHIQATGRDTRARKQYRYHALWRQTRDEAKFGRALAFGRALPRLRRRVTRDLAAPGLARDKVLALVVRLLEATLLRVGNEEYARTNRSFGLTTLRNRHADVRGETVRLSFRGKSGKSVEVGLRDGRVARVVRRLQELPGQRLFQYRTDDDTVAAIDSGDVNDYLRETMGTDFSAKDFRTWAGTVLAAKALLDEVGGAADADGAEGAEKSTPERRVVRAIEQVAQTLGNTPAVCRNCYVHPQIVDAYLDGSLGRAVSPSKRGLRAEERLVLAVLGRRARGGGKKPVAGSAKPRGGASSRVA